MVLKNISPGISYIAKCLILFFLFTACSNTREIKEPLALIWKDSAATGISVSKAFLDRVHPGSLGRDLTVHVMIPVAGPPVLGDRIIRESEVVFQPLVPFTRGLKYEIRFGGKRLGEIAIPGASPVEAPALTGIFPAQDTLPQNLLKLYLRFSNPMQAGQSLQHLTLLRNGRDTMRQVFLDLQPELWNHDGTLLTLWLDPGRIKRGLQPNEKLGEPLEQGIRYQLVVDGRWKDVYGAPLSQSHRKDFVVSLRDTVSPAPAQWTITPPQAGTRTPLQINFHEPLDHVLIREAISIHKENEPVTGAVETGKEESVYRFTPDQPWHVGTYTISSEARLEDLAGNNLDRVFDRDRLKVTAGAKPVYMKKFTVR